MTQTNVSQRRCDLDWLRVIAILSVFVFHSSRFFDTGSWHVKNGITYQGVDIFNAVMVSWMMPLIFVISGASLYYALSKGGFVKFARDKVLRLLVPLVVGIFTHAIWMVYLERTTHGQFNGTFWEFIPHYFEGMYGFGGNFAWMGLHLWYLLILFVFTLVLYPLFRLMHGRGSTMLSTMGDFLARPGLMYLMVVPLMALISVLNPDDSFLGRRDFGGWSLLPYVVFFIYGYALMFSVKLQQSIQNLRWVSVVGVLMTLVATAAVMLPNDPAYGAPRFVIGSSLYALHGWCWILAILGFGMQYLKKTTPFLKYANDAVLPFYIMHQTVLLTVGYLIVRLPIPDLYKWLVVAIISLGAIMGMYELLIRRINVLRFLFGMKLMHREPKPAIQQPKLASGR